MQIDTLLLSMLDRTIAFLSKTSINTDINNISAM